MFNYEDKYVMLETINGKVMPAKVMSKSKSLLIDAIVTELTSTIAPSEIKENEAGEPTYKVGIVAFNGSKTFHEAPDETLRGILYQDKTIEYKDLDNDITQVWVSIIRELT